MLKLGITRPQDLLHAPRWLGRERHASFLLLEALMREGVRDNALYDTLVARVRLPNGTWKQTASGRLRAVDAALLSALEKTHSNSPKLSVLDLGASTGVTSVELYEALARCWSVEYAASDLYRDAFAVGPPGGRWTLVLSAAGDVLQHVLGPFVLPGQLDESAVYPVNRALKQWSERRLVPAARRALAADAGASERSYFEGAEVEGLVVKRLPLVTGRCLELARQSPGFRFVVHDVTRPLNVQATVVRAMNLITPDYFSPAMAGRAIGNALRAVEPAGYLVLGQSRGLGCDALRATVFRVAGRRAEVAARVGEGYELEETVQRAAAEGRASPCKA